MNSKNTGPEQGLAEDLQQQARLAAGGGAVEQDAARCSSATCSPWPGRRSSSIS
jgi:hypothetical protein